MRTALLVVFSLLLAAPSAQAASVKVTWPSDRKVAPGEHVAVTVAAKRKVQVSVVRTNAAGKPIATVAKRSLKKGTLSAKLARAGRYAVRVKDGTRERSRTVTAVAPVAAPAPPAPPASPSPNAPSDPWNCARATAFTVVVQLGAATVTPGGTLPYTVQNTSDGCRTTGVGYGLEFLQADGTWAPVPWSIAVPAIAVLHLQGAVHQRLAYLPPQAALGTYRLLHPDTTGEPPTFEVVAPL